MRRHASMAACALTALATTAGNGPVHRPPPLWEPVVINDNGAWSWFEDERAVIDVRTGTLLVSSVANGAGSGGAARHGNVEVVAYDLGSQDMHRSVLHANLEADDHDSAALFVRPDGRYVAAYSRHTTDGLTRWRVSLGSGSESRWGPEQTFDHGVGTTYSNLYSTPEAGDRLYNFVRSEGRDPHFMVSDDDGSTWTLGGRLLDGPGRPYVRYAIDGIGRIHFVTTEQHPHDFGNSVYHGVIDDGQLRRTDGTAVDTDLSDDAAVGPTSLTKVFTGDDRHRAWTIDLQIDAAGQPYAAFSVRSPDGHPLPLRPLRRGPVARPPARLRRTRALRRRTGLHGPGRARPGRSLPARRLDRRPPCHRSCADQQP